MNRTQILDGVVVFVEVVNAMSFSRAATRLGMPATTVSAKIRRLEERLGTTLLQRTTRRLSLTEAGERYFAHCAKAIDSVIEAELLVANILEEPRGRLRITAPTDLAQTVLVPVVDAYMATYTDVRIELLVSNQHIDLVAEGVDLAIRVGELRNSGLVTRRYFNSAIGLLAATDYLERSPPIRNLADLKQHRLIRMQTGWRGQILHDGSDSLDINSIASNLQVNDMLTCQAFAENGLGVAMLPLFSQLPYRHSSRLTRVLPHVQSEAFSVQFLYPRQSLVPPTVRSFIEMALRGVGATGALIEPGLQTGPMPA